MRRLDQTRGAVMVARVRRPIMGMELGRSRSSIFLASLLLALGVALPTLGDMSGAPPVEPSSSQIQERSAEFQDLTSGKISPPTIQLKDLDKEWRRIVVNEQQDRNNDPYGYGMRNPMYQEILADLGIGVYYTKSQTVTLGGETYLIAYRIQNNLTRQDIQDIMQQIYGGHGAGEEPMRTGQRKFPADTPLKLSLLNLRTTGNLIDVRAFDPKSEIMGPRDVIEASNENLRRIGRFVTRLSQIERYGVRGLPMNDVNTARNAFRNYFHAPMSIFVHPQSRDPYRPNTALAGKRLPLISNRAKLVAFYEPRPGSDGKRGVVFLDGHVERVPEARWTTVKSTKPQGVTARQIDALSLRNLQQLGRQLTMYARRRGGSLPPMHDARTVRQALASYYGYGNDSLYTHPTTKAPYRPNAGLSGRKMNEIANAAKVVAFYEADLGSDGKRGVVFLDGHVERVPQSKWKQVKEVAAQMKQTTKAKTSA
jgi:prepilin-type processing-associated H-X9-DG protein